MFMHSGLYGDWLLIEIYGRMPIAFGGSVMLSASVDLACCKRADSPSRCHRHRAFALPGTPPPPVHYRCGYLPPFTAGT